MSVARLFSSSSPSVRHGSTATTGGRRDLQLGLFLVMGGLALALGAGILSPEEPAALGASGLGMQPPSSEHLLGTDPLGRDVLTRLLHGGRFSLLVGWVSMIVSTLMGTLIGLAAGLGPRRVQRFLTLLIDLFISFPRIYLVLLLVAVSQPSLMLLISVLSLSGWMAAARMVRAESMLLRDREYVAAARGLGLSPWQVALRHVLPNLMPTVLVAASLRIGQVILVESFLSFLGLGAQEPMITWGVMIAQGRAYLLEGWWLTIFPGIAISATVLGYNLLADGIRARYQHGEAPTEGRDRP